MTDILLIVLIVLSVVSILVSLFRRGKTDDSKIVDTVKLLGDMISKNQKDANDYQSQKQMLQGRQTGRSEFRSHRRIPLIFPGKFL